MARKRMIDPSFWIDEKLGTVQPIVRLLFMGLISQADDEGRLNGHPSLIKSLIFPYDHEIQLYEVEEWLNLLAAEERKLIQRYEVDHQKYIMITNFKKHQTINKPQKSKLPPPNDDYGSTTVVVPEREGMTTAQKKGREEKRKEEEEKGKGIELLSLPSSNLHEDHLLKILNDHHISMDKPYPLEQFFSYIGFVDLEVMEAAIKKSSGKRIAYCLGTLEGMVKDGITKKEHLKPKVGEQSEKSQGQIRHGQSTPEDKPITGGKTGALPSKWADKVIQLSNVSG
ncbi:hypothetical protein JCM16163A_41320 [Paenibacillus sp. YK5]